MEGIIQSVRLMLPNATPEQIQQTATIIWNLSNIQQATSNAQQPQPVLATRENILHQNADQPHGTSALQSESSSSSNSSPSLSPVVDLPAPNTENLLQQLNIEFDLRRSKKSGHQRAAQLSTPNREVKIEVWPNTKVVRNLRVGAFKFKPDSAKMLTATMRLIPMRCSAYRCKACAHVATHEIRHGISAPIENPQDFGVIFDENHNHTQNTQFGKPDSLKSLTDERRKELDDYLKEHYHESNELIMTHFNQNISNNDKDFIHQRQVEKAKKLLNQPACQSFITIAHNPRLTTVFGPAG